MGSILGIVLIKKKNHQSDILQSKIPWFFVKINT